MSRSIYFFGDSDDRVEVIDESGTLSQEYSVYTPGQSLKWEALLTNTSTGETAVIRAYFDNNGIWSVTYTAEEGENLPDWKPETWNRHSYSVGIILKEVPDTVTLTVLNR